MSQSVGTHVVGLVGWFMYGSNYKLATLMDADTNHTYACLLDTVTWFL